MGKGAKRARLAALAAETQPAATFTDSPAYSIGDPAFADFIRMSVAGFTGEASETNAFGLTAYYRANALIAGTIAGLPLKVYQDQGDGRRQEVPHFLSVDPAGPFDLSAFSWVEMIVLHLLNHAEAYLKAIYNEGGELIGLWPVHPLAVTEVKWSGADKAGAAA